MERKLVTLKTPEQPALARKDHRIVLGRVYLGRVHGQWGAGDFTRQWYGWNWNAIYDAGTQIEWIEELYDFDPPIDGQRPIIADILEDAFASADLDE